MIVTLTANACLDHTVYVPSLSAAATEKPLRECIQAGGKGVNVARILRALGENVHSLVVVGGETGERIVTDLRSADIQHTAVYSPGNSRTYLERIEAECFNADGTLLDAGDLGRAPHGRHAAQRHGAQQHGAVNRSRSTKEFFAGLHADAKVASTLFEVIDALLTNAKWFAFCGSLAPGLPANLIAKIIARCREKRVLCAVDSHGPALTQAWRAGPDLLRVNIDEATETLQCAPHEISIERCFALGHATRGVISNGENAFLAWGGVQKRFRVVPPRTRTLNPTGCGDAMLAGLLFKLADAPYCNDWRNDSRSTDHNTNYPAQPFTPADQHEFESTQERVNAACSTQENPKATPSFTRALRFATALAAAESEAPFAGHPDLARTNSLEPQVQIRILR